MHAGACCAGNVGDVAILVLYGVGGGGAAVLGGGVVSSEW